MSELSHYIASLGTILPLFAALFRLRSYVQTYCLEYWGQQKERIPASFEDELGQMQDYITHFPALLCINLPVI